MKQYLSLLKDILKKGNKKNDRTGVGTLSLFGYNMRFDLSSGFPILTTKKCHFKSIVFELLWFLKGSTNIKFLKDNGVNIWNEWANKSGELGPIYGRQWRSWQTKENRSIDQINNAINLIKNEPDSRRIIVSSWNVGDLNEMSIYPCHCLFQFYVINNKLSCHLYQRSGDAFLGVPFNIASYALLTNMIAQICELDVGELIHTLGDVHLYSNHISQAKMQIKRKPFKLPTLLITKKNSLFDFEYNDFKLDNYKCHPHIKADVAI